MPAPPDPSPMLAYLVTGVSGAGKSTVARRLREWGHTAISLDADTRLCAWVDEAGHRVQRPNEPDTAWLATHQWKWDPDRLDHIIAAARQAGVGTFWLCGRADNATSLTDRFDALFLLDADQRTVRQRLTRSSRGNDFGHTGDTLQAALAAHTEILATWRRRGAYTIDATQPLDRVVEDLLMAGAHTALHLRYGR